MRFLVAAAAYTYLCKFLYRVAIDYFSSIKTKLNFVLRLKACSVAAAAKIAFLDFTR